MVLTLRAYNPLSKFVDSLPGGIDHPAGQSLIRFAVRVLTRKGEIVIDFGELKDITSYNDSLSVEGASGSWSIRMRHNLHNEVLLRRLHPGMVVEIYASRNADPLEGVHRNPSQIQRIETAPDLTKYQNYQPLQPVQPTGDSALGASNSAAIAGVPATLQPGRYGGVTLNAEQLRNVAIIASVGQQVGASPRDVQIAIATAYQESRIRNLNYGDADSVGMFQQRTSQEWGTIAQIMNPAYSARAFFTGAGSNRGLLDIRNRNQMSVAQAAQRVQRSAFPNAYARWERMSAAVVARLTGQALPTVQATSVQPVATQPAEVLGEPVKAVDDYYLDKCPYLLMRGIVAKHGRGSSPSETDLTISGESYGKIYKDAFVLTDLNAPDLAATSLEVRNATIVPLGLNLIYYRLLKEWVESFWGNSTGWEARTRVIPFPPNYLTRINSEGSVWSALQYLSISGFFHLFCDHTGALCWEKLPWSGKEQSLIEGRNWEDLPLIKLPSWKISRWSDSLDESGVNNFIRCVPTQQGTSGGQETVAMPALIYNMGSIRQYGGPHKRELQFPTGVGADQYYTSAARRTQQATINSFTALCALECIRWFDRPVQRVSVSVMGDAAWRINLRTEITENWSHPNAKPGEYYITSRSHQIDLSNGRWTTSMELVRDRRTRYLGVGNEGLNILLDNTDRNTPLAFSNVDSFTDNNRLSFGAVRFQRALQLQNKRQPTQPDTSLPLAPDEYWFFDRFTGQVIKIGSDPIAWAYKNVIPRLSEETQPIVTQPPVSQSGQLPNRDTGASADLIDRVYTRYFYDQSPPGSYDFTLFRGGTQRGVRVPAMASGVITMAEYRNGYGYCVEIQGDDGYRYFQAHFESLLVRRGERVNALQAISIQGTTGSSTGIHIHTEVRDRNGTRIQNRSITEPIVRAYLDRISGGRATLFR